MSAIAADAILDVFRPGRPPAIFVTELAHALNVPPAQPEFLAALERLQENGTIIISSNEPPDPHLSGIDLRIVAHVLGETVAARGAATLAAQTCWRGFLAMFLASHRCQ
jgi:hypothetical protein